MKNIIRVVVCCFAATTVAALAQDKSAGGPLAAVITLREGMASAIIKGDEKPDKAIARLLAHPSPTGLKIDRDADFGFAAIDVGLRLIAAGKPVEAELFFRAAEKSLDKMVKKTPDTASAEKAQYLGNLALIRASYLNNALQAKSDLDDAKKLRPDDKYLDGLRDTLGSERGDVFKKEVSKK